MNLPHTMQVERLGTTTALKETYTSRPDVACFLQPAAERFGLSTEGQVFSKNARCYVDYAANVKGKDRVTINGKRYTVAGERTHQYGTWPHRVLSLEEQG